jgi:hypothetical protein
MHRRKKGYLASLARRKSINGIARVMLIFKPSRLERSGGLKDDRTLSRKQTEM